ncbi:hypothetical protein KIN20_004493 [Parelaphostrongylus tenuis]|uniref:Uncharacterized protein n=1 Tax=Parelaphostrongylus tenuis TaxID=148309 RepID=A0AAD5LYJ4_PARTN|nr:hypothetical protein KIN20_004493 [Parelaphostrongylus tenuis]
MEHLLVNGKESKCTKHNQLFIRLYFNAFVILCANGLRDKAFRARAKGTRLVGQCPGPEHTDIFIIPQND